jgi:uncharacterized OB-fold protein
MAMVDAHSPRSIAVSPYADGIDRGVLRYQRCSACGAPQTLARYACQRCGNTSLAWFDSAGSGKVYAATIVTRAPSEEFRALAPYTLVLVDLDEGSRVMAHGEPGLEIGDAVSAAKLVHAGKSLIIFKPRKDTP